MGGFPLTKWLALQDVLADPDIPPLSACLFACLLEHHNTKTGLCFPSETTLGAKLGRTDRSIRNGLRCLKKAGYVRVLRGQGPKGTNLYDLRIPSGNSSPGRPEKTCRKPRKERSDKPVKEPLNEPWKPRVLKNRWRVYGTSKAANAEKRACLERFLVERLGGGADAWTRLQNMEEALDAINYGRLDDNPNAIDSFAKSMILKSFWE